MGPKREVGEALQLRNEAVERAEPGADPTAATAAAAVVALGTPVMRDAQRGGPLAQDRHPDPGEASLEIDLGAAPGMRRAGVDPIRHVPVTVALAGKSHQALHLVVVRGDVVVADRPVGAVALEGRRLEVELTVPEARPPPRVRAAAYCAQARPVEALERIVGVLPRIRVEMLRVFVDLPQAVVLAGRTVSPERQLPWQRCHVEVGRGIERPAGFEHDDLQAGAREDPRGGCAAGAGSDHDHVVDGRHGGVAYISQGQHRNG